MTREDHLLTILAEECVEVAQRVTKALRFGIDEVQHDQSFTNRERLRQEYGDLVAAFEMTGIAPPTREAIDAKKAKVENFLVYSKKCGRLTG